jgi:hypothetical protein
VKASKLNAATQAAETARHPRTVIVFGSAFMAFDLLETMCDARPETLLLATALLNPVALSMGLVQFRRFLF